ncbi:PepSY domain-containing protein [Chitinophaga sp. Cy-1792]|uniref:PepSY-associated TM helix domain-containing protein n=1 Tax=Chitinophaga sp. Cy-1792 TaxID=2608339 RepID=UPI00141E178F|nr:PepSY-associated TM helix domain-containing protein [Chitinophaga sp. Cy-1792]NIG53679.1 PepSY domain-containing protein [Chitinophaga sp. Cy-1792]
MQLNKNKSAGKKNSRSLFYRISAWLHLWLGLISGIIVMIICITGCIWVFNEEITSYMEPESNISLQEKPVLPPSGIMAVAAKAYPGKQVGAIVYKDGKAVEVTVGGRRGGSTLKINPYSGEVVSKVTRKPGDVNFFRWVLNGHRFLWLPFKIGRPIINYSTLVFVVTLISGMVLWWPKKWNKSTRQQSFKIKWGASTKRVNYDLHNVLGFYALLVLFAIGCTGMVYGLEWWSKGTYWVTTGGRTLPPFKEAVSDSLQAGKLSYTLPQKIDVAWKAAAVKHPASKGFYIGLPDTAKAGSSIMVIVYPSKGQYYNLQRYSFDQHTLQEIKGDPENSQSYEDADVGGKLRRMNFDIHVGSILGLPGKVLAFFASLIGATLPVTGFIIWWGKGKKKKPVPRAKEKQLTV